MPDNDDDTGARAGLSRRGALLALAAAAGTACDKRLLGGARGTGPTGLPSGAVALSVAPPPPLPPPPVVPPAPGAAAPTSFADLAAKADPAVVFVKTLQEQRVLTGRRVVGEGLGSAFVYDPNGLILTNNHVIENASEIHVIFGRTREMSATVVGRDPHTDVAVLRVDAKELAALPLKDSDAVRVGD